VSRVRIVVVAFAVLVVLASACGSHSKTTDVVAAGQVDIKLPPGWKVVDGKAVRPAGGEAATAPSSGAASASGGTGDTIPLAQDDPQTKFFKATGQFQNCLKANGTKFVGAPDQSKPDSPTNNPDYIKSLTTCAAQSKIVQAMQDMQAAQDKLTPDEIKQQNEQFLIWRTCMIGKGWDIAQPTPDAKGRLFSFGGGGGGAAAQIKPPPGKDLFSSGDLQDCAAKAQKASKKS
jgi:uncharacterized protein YbdZ (MbtH family)